MTNATSWPAPAKLNLFLHITGRRADGYHLLQSVFQFLDYGDSLAFTLRSDGGIRRNDTLPGVAPEQDLIYRAARLLQEHTRCSRGADIALHKHLPMGGGLGGGSSDAATTLVALNQLWQLGLPQAELANLGLKLGADVPVFIHGEAAWAEGVGEQLTPIDLPEPWFVVIIPPIQVATGEIFNAPELTRDCPPITIRDFLSGCGSNVCQPLVAKRYPAVAEALEWLGQYGRSIMTGTGACVFAAFDARTQAEEVFRQRPSGWQGFVAQGKNRSPLLARLAETEFL